MLPRPSACEGCPLNPLASGFMKPAGRNSLGVVLVGEALGEQEASEGRPFVGPAGHILNNALTRAGIDRGSLLILNAISCRPPDNQLYGKPYFLPALGHCLHAHLEPALRQARPKIIVTLGAVPLLSLTNEGGIMQQRGYPRWSDRFDCWILPTIHPSFIQRGNFNYEAVLIHDLQRAVEIATVGYTPRWGDYVLDPTPSEALAWAKRDMLSPNPLSADIETAGKGESEDEVSLDDESYAITRISFSSTPWEGMSVPWRPEYMPVIRLLLEGPQDKIFWNASYDVPRIQFNGVDIGGTIHDGMVAWHVLNSDLRKNLGTVATFLTPDQPRWKHLSGDRPAFYNACDSDVALRCTLRAFEELKKVGLWQVYERHVLRLDKITSRMSQAGMPIDPERRLASAKRIAEHREVLDRKLEEVVPFELRPKFVYKVPPREREGLMRVGSQEVPVCTVCGYERPPKAHFGKRTEKFPNRHQGNVQMVEVGQWARMEPLKVSSKLLLSYMTFAKHPKIYQGKGEDRKPTANENAIRQLLLKYPDDPLYPLVLEISKLRTLAGRYIGKIGEDGKVHGGLMIGRDGRVHPVFSHNPSTLRQASENPNMQNIPRDRADDEWYGLVKRMFVAAPGHVFIERDYSGIESILVGYFSGSRLYTRLSKIDIHSFVTAWALYDLEGRLKYEDVPKAEWSDDDLRVALRDIKKRFKPNRQGIKHMGHAANYMAKSRKIQEVLFDELGIMVPVKEIKKFLEFYKGLFPEIPMWHRELARQVDGTRSYEIPGLKTGAGYARNPYGYLHRFYEVIRWKKIHGKWEWELGEAANALIAFGPQSTAAGILKEAAIRFDDNHPDLARFLRLFIHDSILGEVEVALAEEFDYYLRTEMSKPNLELPLDPSWGMGDYLSIPTEGKIGRVWGEMEDIRD